MLKFVHAQSFSEHVSNLLNTHMNAISDKKSSDLTHV
jgi:hypothetical protein